MIEGNLNILFYILVLYFITHVSLYCLCISLCRLLSLLKCKHMIVNTVVCFYTSHYTMKTVKLIVSLRERCLGVCKVLTKVTGER